MGNLLQLLQQQVAEFRDERNWAQFHNPKDLAIYISLEAAELLESFQWKSPQEIESLIIQDSRTTVSIAHELADGCYSETVTRVRSTPVG